MSAPVSRFWLLLAGCVLVPALAVAQAVPDSVRQLPAVVVTATKGARDVRAVAIPTQVLTRQEIAAIGATRLSDLLAEQPGLALVQEFGTGVQVQGFAPDYTLILIDGEPVVGRQGGTLNLDRLTVSGIERVEIVKGPSSSLYGSEALAGVINLITRRPDAPLRLVTSARYETHKTVDATTEASFQHQRLGGRFLLNRYGSDGYDLARDLPGATAPGFTDYTANAQLHLSASDRTDLRLTARYGQEQQRNAVGVVEQGELLEYEDDSRRDDWSAAGTVVYRPGPAHRLQSTLYAARFMTDTTVRNPDTDAVLTRSLFDQFYGKTETQLDWIVGPAHLATFGGGVIRESVAADRVRGGFRGNLAGFAFAQHDWRASARLGLVVSARLDAHPDHTPQVSPKLAAQYRVAEALYLRASLGSGFKAPTFQQRYMDFTNAVGGYAVYGANDAAAVLRELETQGLLEAYVVAPDRLGELRPESALAVNVGGAYTWGRGTLHVNLFRNQVRDLIETGLVAFRTSGQQVFSYFNLHRIYTQGIEAGLDVQPGAGFTLRLGYQYLDTADRDVLAALDAGTIFTRDATNRDRRATRDDYGGLFSRSRHSGTLRLQYERPRTSVALRGLWRGRYGYADTNGNLILDDAGEYVPGYTLWHLTVTRALGTRLHLQTGLKNLFNETNPTYIPSLPGRLYFAGLRLEVD